MSSDTVTEVQGLPGVGELQESLQRLRDLERELRSDLDEERP